MCYNYHLRVVYYLLAMLPSQLKLLQRRRLIALKPVDDSEPVDEPVDEVNIRRSKRRRIFRSEPRSSLLMGPFDVIIINDDVSTPEPLGASDETELTRRQDLLALNIPLGERPDKIVIPDLITPV